MKLHCPSCECELLAEDVDLQSSIANCHQCKRVFYVCAQIRRATEGATTAIADPPELHCPSCKRSLQPTDVDLKSSSGTCQVCANVFSLFTQISDHTRPPLDILAPERFTIVQQGGEVDIAFTAIDPISQMITIGASIASWVFAGFLIAMLLESASGDVVTQLFLAISAVVAALGFSLFTIKAARRRASIKLSRNELMTVDCPPHQEQGVTIAAKDIRSFAMVKGEYGHEVIAHTERKNIVVAEHAAVEDTQFLFDLLNDYYEM